MLALLEDAAADRYLAARIGTIVGLAGAAKNRFFQLNGIDFCPLQGPF